VRKADSLLVADIMSEALSVEEDATLIRALSFMHKHHLRDVPVVKDGKLVGLASRVDIGRAFLSTWFTSPDD
jgi:CBS domain-containing protein